jgi:glycosyltransferase involved in cell wall biosynthesis
MKPVKVLILIDRLGRGGVAQVAINLALSLNRELFSPIICTTREKPTHGHDDILKQAGVPLIELNRRSRMEVFSWGPLLRVLPTVDILHTHQTGSNFWGRLWGKLYRVPVIITHEHTAANEKNRVEHMIDRMMSVFSDRIVTVSQFDRDLSLELENLPPNKVEPIYVGIDTAKFAPTLTQQEARQKAGLPLDKKLIAIIARLVPQKNHRGLFAALTRLPDALKEDVHCLVIGSGDLEAPLRRDVTSMGLQDRVSFLGERTDIPVVLQAIDLLTLPSHWECLPSIISEALASKCPVVATAVGGVPEILDGVGWPLVQPNNVDNLTAALTHVLQMPDQERNKIADAGRQRILQKFSKEVFVAQVERLYSSLLNSSAKTTATQSRS